MTVAGERGVTLLETIVAVLVLSTAVLAMLREVNAYATSFERARAGEIELAAADRVMTATSLLTRADLDRRIGVHRIGEFAIDVQRPGRSIYRVAIRVPDRPRALLVTLLHRAEGGTP